MGSYCLPPATCISQCVIGTQTLRGGVSEDFSFSVGDCCPLSPAPVSGGTSSFFLPPSLNFILQVFGIYLQSRANCKVHDAMFDVIALVVKDCIWALVVGRHA